LLNIASAYTSAKDKQKLGLVLNQIGETHKLLGGYNEAIRHHEKALKIFEELENKEQLSITNFYIGNCYNWADELDIAFNYLDTSLKLAEKLRSPELKIKTLGSLAILFTKQNKFYLPSRINSRNHSTIFFKLLITATSQVMYV